MGSPGEVAGGAEVGAISPRRRGGWRAGLPTAILLVAATAVGLAVVDERRRIAELAPRVEQLRRMARELVGADPTRPAAARVEPLWADDDRWNVYLPPGGPYRLCMATRAVDVASFPAAGATATIGPGDHEVALLVEPHGAGWQARATVDGRPKLARDEPAAWKVGYSSASSDVGGDVRSFPPGSPIVLARRRHLADRPDGRDQVSRGPAPGILLWIETDATTARQP